MRFYFNNIKLPEDYLSGWLLKKMSSMHQVTLLKKDQNMDTSNETGVKQKCT